jgi:hypothetical protein
MKTHENDEDCIVPLEIENVETVIDYHLCQVFECRYSCDPCFQVAEPLVKSDKRKNSYVSVKTINSLDMSSIAIEEADRHSASIEL